MMNTTFHFRSAQDIGVDVLEAIRVAYREKPVSLSVSDEAPSLPSWQIEEMRRRDAITGCDVAYFLDGNSVMSELEKELETV